MRPILALPFLLAGLACGAGGDSAGGASADDHSDDVSRASSDNAAPADITGSYSVTGTNPDGSAYERSLEVTQSGDVYRFAWATGQDYQGIGVVNGGAIAVGWGGAECGAVLYRVGAGGDLSGRWILGDSDVAGTETARHSDGGTGLAGTYSVEGSNPDGTAYAGTLAVTSAGDAYRLAWESGGTTVGEGLPLDEMFGASYGSDSCGIAVYRIDGGTLDGVWTTYGAGASGTERVVRQ